MGGIHHHRAGVRDAPVPGQGAGVPVLGHHPHGKPPANLLIDAEPKKNIITA